MKDTPKPRQIEIFRLLMTSGVPLDINLLKEKLQKSERTIRYDIQDLKRICQEYGIEIGYLTKKGYFIPAAQKPECSALLVQWDSGGKNSFVDDEEEKRFTSLFFYLFVQKGYVTAEKLAEVYLGFQVHADPRTWTGWRNISATALSWRSERPRVTA